jgi:hypothetical protein
MMYLGVYPESVRRFSWHCEGGKHHHRQVYPSPRNSKHTLKYGEEFVFLKIRSDGKICMYSRIPIYPTQLLCLSYVCNPDTSPLYTMQLRYYPPIPSFRHTITICNSIAVLRIFVSSYLIPTGQYIQVHPSSGKA